MPAPAAPGSVAGVDPEEQLEDAGNMTLSDSLEKKITRKVKELGRKGSKIITIKSLDIEEKEKRGSEVLAEGSSSAMQFEDVQEFSKQKSSRISPTSSDARFIAKLKKLSREGSKTIKNIRVKSFDSEEKEKGSSEIIANNVEVTTMTKEISNTLQLEEVTEFVKEKSPKLRILSPPKSKRKPLAMSPTKSRGKEIEKEKEKEKEKMQEQEQEQEQSQEQEQEQSQEQEQEQSQEQGQEQSQEQGQEQSQEQGQEQGQEQSQEQGQRQRHKHGQEQERTMVLMEVKEYVREKSQRRTILFPVKDKSKSQAEKLSREIPGSSSREKTATKITDIQRSNAVQDSNMTRNKYKKPTESLGIGLQLDEVVEYSMEKSPLLFPLPSSSKLKKKPQFEKGSISNSSQEKTGHGTEYSQNKFLSPINILRKGSRTVNFDEIENVALDVNPEK